VKKPEAYIIVFSLLLILAIANLFAAFRIYQRTSQLSVLPAGTKSRSVSAQPDTIVADMRTLLDKNSVRRDTYQLIAEKNLLSRQRKAWQPPVAKETKQEEVVSQAKRTDVILFGTFTLGTKKGALLEFKKFTSGQRKKTVFVGETVAPPEGSKSQVQSYTLVEVGSSSVMIKDQRGVAFHLDLYEGKQRSGAVSAARKEISVAGVSTKKQESVVVVGGSGSTDVQESVAKKQPTASLQQQLDSGSVRKITTPFGTAYVKSKKGPQKVEKTK